jgi:hypothetical protein
MATEAHVEQSEVGSVVNESVEQPDPGIGDE